MGSIRRYLSKRVQKDGRAEVYLRVTVSHSVQYKVRSGVLVRADKFKEKTGQISKGRSPLDAEAAYAAEAALSKIESRIVDYLAEAGQGATRQGVEGAVRPAAPAVDGRQPPEEGPGFFDAWADFADRPDVCEGRRRSIRAVGRAMWRCERYEQAERRPFRWSLSDQSAHDLERFEQFYRGEHLTGARHPEIYQDAPPRLAIRTGGRADKPEKRGRNRVASVMGMIRAFYAWARRQGVCGCDPFARYAMPRDSYGTPVYLTAAERDRLADFDLSARPSLERQRDVFVFQCLTGCRVGDMRRLTGRSVSGGVLAYVPHKTSKRTAEVVRVPLNARAAAIVAKYGARGDAPLLPFISDQKYNAAIKEAMALAGIDRVVAMPDPKTGEAVARRLCDAASSHMARRTFIGNLYKLVKDPALIGSMSGHAEGSRAFARYRAIDDDDKRGAVDLL